MNTKEKEDIKGLRKELLGYLKEISKQKENNFQRRGEGWHKLCARTVKDLQELHEPNREEVDSYLAFDKNSVEFEKQLTKLGLCLHDIPGDGNCLFRALGDQLEGHQRNHFKHRCDVVDYMVKHRYAFEPFIEDGISFDRYTARLRKMGTHAGNDAIVAFAELHNLSVIIHQLDQPILTISGAKVLETAQELHIAYHNGEHYSSVKRINVKTPVPKSQVGEPRRKMDIQEQHEGSHRKTEASSSARSNHRDDVPKLNHVKETHHNVMEAGDNQTSGSIPREDYCLRYKVHKAVLRYKESFRQKPQKATRMEGSALGQKTPKAVLRDKNSLIQKTQKGAIIGHTNLVNMKCKVSNVVNIKYKASNSVNMKNKASNETCEYKNSMTLKEFLDYFIRQDLSVIDFMEAKEFIDYCDSNSMTTLGLVNELKRDPKTKEREEKRFMEKERAGQSNVRRQEEMTEKSNIEGQGLDSKKPIQASGQKERVHSNKDKAIADDGESSVDNLRSTPVLNPKMDDEQSSVSKDGKVQGTQSQPVLDTEARYVKLKGKSSSSKVKDEYKVYQPEIKSKCLEKSGIDLEVGYSPQGHSDEEHSSELPIDGSQGSSPVIQKCSTTSTVLGMCDTHCSIEDAEKQMTKLDEESDLGHMNPPSTIRDTAIRAPLRGKENNLCKSNLRITNSIKTEKSSDVEICVGGGVMCSQTAEIIEDQDKYIPDQNVKEKVYIPPHRRSNQDWQEHVKKGFTGQKWNVNSKSYKGSEENSEPEGAHLGPILELTNNLVGTEGEQISLVSEDIPERGEVNTYSKDSSRNLTKSIEIQVDMDFRKPQSRDASVQCELIEGSRDRDISTSMEDFDSYFQSHQGLHQQENNLSDKLGDSLLSESVTSVVCCQQLDAGSDLTDLETGNQVEDGQPDSEPCSSSTPVEYTMELVHNMDSGVHSSDREINMNSSVCSSDGEVNSINESKELVKLHDPISLPSMLVTLDLETVPKEWYKDTSSGFPDFKYSKETSCGVLMNQHLATSLVYAKMIELQGSQRCKDPLKELGLV